MTKVVVTQEQIDKFSYCSKKLLEDPKNNAIAQGLTTFLASEMEKNAHTMKFGNLKEFILNVYVSGRMDEILGYDVSQECAEILSGLHQKARKVD